MRGGGLVVVDHVGNALGGFGRLVRAFEVLGKVVKDQVVLEHGHDSAGLVVHDIR